MLTTSFVEIERHPVGIVWHEQAGCLFIAASQSLSSIDGRLFPSSEAATDAARAILVSQSLQRDADVRSTLNRPIDY